MQSETSNRQKKSQIQDYAEREVLQELSPSESLKQMRDHRARQDIEKDNKKYHKNRYHSIQQTFDLHHKLMTQRSRLILIDSKSYRDYIQEITDPKNSVYQTGKLQVCFTCWQWVCHVQSAIHRNLGHQVSVGGTAAMTPQEQRCQAPIQSEGAFYHLAILFNKVIREQKSVFKIEEYVQRGNIARMNEHSDKNPVVGMNLLNAHMKIS